MAQTGILVQLLVTSFALFLLAHLLFFHLYFPSRYVKFSLPFVLAIAAGLALGILIQAIAGRVAPSRQGFVAEGLALGLGLALAAYPGYYNGHFVQDSHPGVTGYLRSQPKDILVAGVPQETDLTPTFAGRRVLANYEYALPFHGGYYGPLRRRIEDLIEAYYAEWPGDIADFAARYG